jgi:hypothetical protein
MKSSCGSRHFCYEIFTGKPIVSRRTVTYQRILGERTCLTRAKEGKSSNRDPSRPADPNRVASFSLQHPSVSLSMSSARRDKLAELKAARAGGGRAKQWEVSTSSPTSSSGLASFNKLELTHASASCLLSLQLRASQKICTTRSTRRITERSSRVDLLRMTSLRTTMEEVMRMMGERIGEREGGRARRKRMRKMRRRGRREKVNPCYDS